MATIRLKIIDAQGVAIVPTTVELAVLPFGTFPTSVTSWISVTYTAYVRSDSNGNTGQVQVVLAGPQADSTGAIPIFSTRADLWVRVTDAPEVQAVKIDTVRIG